MTRPLYSLKSSMLTFGFAAAALTAMSGCADDVAPFDTELGKPKDDGTGGKAEGYNTNSDNPFTFAPDLVDTYASLPKTGETARKPWAANYWPTWKDNINDRWAGPNTVSPAAKYGAAFGVTGVEDAVSRYHGIDSQGTAKTCATTAECDTTVGEECSKRTGATSGKCIQTWFGICHAWAPAAIMYEEPKHAVTFGGQEFKVNDIKALVTLANNSVDSKFVSLRCNDRLKDIALDQYGRPVSTSCRYTNAATYHLILANFLGLRKAGFVEDRTFDYEVWNQPVRGFQVTAEKEVTPAEANALIGATGGTSATVTGAVAKDAWTHFGPYTVAAGDSVGVAMTGNNDADLYVGMGSQPTKTTYACRPYGDNSVENCNLNVPAGVTQFYVSANGFAASSDFEIKLKYGTVPSTYIFNAAAAKLVYLKTDVQWIAESPAHVDGNLGSTIDTYTHTDKYEYVLEIDAGGKVIGGEWVGSSKTAHPDFLWLPTGLSQASVAGGKITWANVKKVYDLSIDAPGAGTGTTTPPTTVNETGTVAKAAWKHYGPFNGSDIAVAMTGTGDADLYVRRGAQPTAADYDCRPYAGGTAEDCSVNGAGPFYVSVNGYAATSNFTLAISFTTGTTPTPTPTPTTATVVNETGTVVAGEWKQLGPYTAAELSAVMTVTGDADLYVRKGAQPTSASYDCRPYKGNNVTETCNLSGAASYYLAINGYTASSTFALKVEYK